VGCENRRSPPVSISGLTFSTFLISGMCTDAAGCAPWSTTLTTVIGWAQGPRETALLTFTLNWVGEQTPLCASFLLSSDGRTGRALCATCPYNRGYMGSCSFVYPIVNHLSTGRAEQQCAEAPNFSHTFRTLRRWEAPHPGVSLFLSPGLRCETPV